MLKDGQFAVGAPTDLGLLFKFRSVYGVSSDGTEYGGTAYMPSETTVAWEDIPYNEGDPCALVAPTGTWRLPTKAEYVELIKTYEVTTIDGVAGMNRFCHYGRCQTQCEYEFPAAERVFGALRERRKVIRAVLRRRFGNVPT